MICVTDRGITNISCAYYQKVYIKHIMYIVNIHNLIIDI